MDYHYRTLKSNSTDELDAIVSEWIKDGDWELYGNPYTDDMQYYQAVKKVY